MLTSIMTELKTWFFTGRVLLLTAFVLAGFAFFAFSSLSYIKSLSARFDHLIDLVDDDEKTKGLLDESLYDHDGRVNELLEKKMGIESVLFSISYKNSTSFCEEALIYLIPVFMTIIGSLTISQDLTTEVLRLRVSREGKWKYLAAKQIVMIKISVALTVVSCGLHRIVTPFFFHKAVSIVDTVYIDTYADKMCDIGIMLQRAMFVFLCMLLFLEVGFCIGYFFKTPVISTGIICFIWYFNLVSFRYDPKNIVYNIAVRLFDFKGVIPNGMSFELPLYRVILLFSLMLWLPLLLVVIIWKKRSAYR